MSDDTLSAAFPTRHIKPLPKRRLKDKLPSEAALSIEYPSNKRYSLPIFYPSYGSRTAVSSLAHVGTTLGRNDESPTELEERNNRPRSPKEGFIPENPSIIRPNNSSQYCYSSDAVGTQHLLDFQLALSAASSTDGYDYLENINNKKKRKIPSSGDGNFSNVLPHSDGLYTAASSGFYKTQQETPKPDIRSANVNTLSNSVQQSLKATKSKLSRRKGSRHPLQALPDGINNWPKRDSYNAQLNYDDDAQSIFPNTPDRLNNAPIHRQGQENILHHRSKPSKATVAASTFTFSCGPQASRTAQWHYQFAEDTMTAERSPATTTANNTPTTDVHAFAGAADRPNGRRRGRRQLDRELRSVAETRRQENANALYHSPPQTEDIWICEFCEYESIFGLPPRALIRNYELKDRRQKREEAGRKRLLEKAKAKGKKGKKPAKANKKQGVLSNSSQTDTEKNDLNLQDGPLSGNSASRIGKEGSSNQLSSVSQGGTTAPNLLPSKGKT